MTIFRAYSAKIKGFVSIVAITAMSGCAVNKSVQLTAPFDEKLANRMLAQGSNQIQGSGLIRQKGGGIVTCAGGQVFLMPVTERAKEWAKTVYGSEEMGFFNVQNTGSSFDVSDPVFSHVKMSYCDAQGAFAFENVADGTFLTFTRITWNIGSSPQLHGGSVMKKVTVSDGKTVKVVLSPT